ncbi:Rab family, other, partial [Globisporangium splendens]
MEQQYDVLYKGAYTLHMHIIRANVGSAAAASSDNNKNAGGTVKGFSSVRKPTIGVEFGTKIVQHPNGKRIKAQIWDTAGQERYRAITSSHYRRAAGALVVYDVMNRASFEHAQQHWLKELKAQADISSTLTKCIALVGNKIDLLDTNSTTTASPAAFVSDELHDSVVLQLNVIGQRSSAKTGQNVRKTFEDLLIAIYDEDKGKYQRLERAATIHLEENNKASGSFKNGSHQRSDLSKCCSV